MKPSKQLSLIALLSLLTLTACTNNDDAKKNETTSVASGTQDTAPSADETMIGTENSGATISASSEKDEKDEMIKEEFKTDKKGSEKQTVTKKQDMNKEEYSDDKDGENEDKDNESKTAPSPATITNTVVAPAKSAPTSTASTSSAQSTKTGQVNYKTPAGSDMMRVNITTSKDGTITGASVTPLATNAVSLKFQQSFASKVSGSVIGKSIKGLKVDTISGASLTTAAFNDFLASNSN